MTWLSLNKARVILDIGTNDGRWLTSVYDIFPQATIHAFEPVPTTYDELCSAIASSFPAVSVKLGRLDENVKITTGQFCRFVLQPWTFGDLPSAA
jgi:FkbM family methyltransferase